MQFWTGSFTSYASLQALLKDDLPKNIVLLTCLDPESRLVLPSQDTHVNSVINQAKILKISLLLVPIQGDFVESAKKGLESLDLDPAVARLVFADRIPEIEQWRKASFEEYSCFFPLKEVSTKTLLEQVQTVDVKVSKVRGDLGIAVGDVYGSEVVERLASMAGVSVLGENGEFLTQVELE